MTENTLIDTYILPHEKDNQKVKFYEGSIGYSDEYIEDVAYAYNVKLILFYTLDKKRFIKWLMEDDDDLIYFAKNFRNEILEKGFANATAESLLKERDTVPVWLLEEYNDRVKYEVEEIDVDEIKLI